VRSSHRPRRTHPPDRHRARRPAPRPRRLRWRPLRHLARRPARPPAAVGPLRPRAVNPRTHAPARARV